MFSFLTSPFNMCNRQRGSKRTGWKQREEHAIFRDLPKEYRPLRTPLFSDDAPSKLNSSSEMELMALAKEVRNLMAMAQKRTLSGHYL